MYRRSIGNDSDTDVGFLVGVAGWPEETQRGIFYNMPTAAADPSRLIYWAQDHVFQNETQDIVLAVRNSKRVGIGTADPEMSLHVVYGAGTAGAYVPGTPANVLIEALGDEASLMLKSPPNQGQFILASDDVFEMYAGWYGSTHAAAQKWEMVAEHYEFYNSSYLSSVIFKDMATKLGVGINSAYADIGSGLRIQDWGNSSLVIEDATNAKITFTVGGADAGYVGYNGALDVLLESVLGDVVLFSTNDVTYWAGTLGDHIWYRNGTSAEVMRIDGSNGRLGIGEDVPEASLHVRTADSEAFKISRLNNSAYMRIEYDDVMSPHNSWFLGHYSGGNPFLNTTGGQLNWTHSGGLLWIKTSDTNEIAFGTQNTERMRIDSDGFVGINMSVPTERFEVSDDLGDVLNDQITLIQSRAVVTNGSRLYTRHVAERIAAATAWSSTEQRLEWQVDASANTLASIRIIRDSTTTSNHKMAFNVGNAERMRIDQNGKLGIGTASPSGLFHIAAGTVTEPTYGAADQLILQGVAATNIYMNIVCDPAKKAGIRFSDAALAPGQIQYDHNDDSMAFNTGGTGEKLRIDSAGRVGLGVTAPSAHIDITTDTQAKIAFHNTSSGAGGSNGLEVGYSDASVNAIIWNREAGFIRFGTSGVERGRFSYDGGFFLQELSAAAASVVSQGQFWVKNNTPNTPWFQRDDGSTGQIAMDYEEGTFTPHLVDTSYNESEGQTYGTNRYGRYMRIGRMVHVCIDLEISSLGSLTTSSQAAITGLPFTAASGIYRPLYAGYYGSMALPLDKVPVGLVVAGGTHLTLWQLNGSAAASSALSIAQWSAGGRLVLSGWYEIA